MIDRMNGLDFVKKEGSQFFEKKDGANENCAGDVLRGKILSIVFSYLNSSDFKSARIVTRIWNKQSVGSSEFLKLLRIKGFAKFLENHLPQGYLKQELSTFSRIETTFALEGSRASILAFRELRGKICALLKDVPKEQVNLLKLASGSSPQSRLLKKTLFPLVRIYKFVDKMYLNPRDVISPSNSLNARVMSEKLIQEKDLGKAEELADITPKYDSFRHFLLRDLCNALVNERDFKSALRVAQKMELFQEDAFSLIGKELIKEKDFIKAEEMADKMEFGTLNDGVNYPRDRFLRDLCQALVNERDFESSVRVANKIGQDDARLEVVCLICQELTREGYIERAKELVMSIPECFYERFDSRRDKVLTKMSEVLQEKEDLDGMEQLADVMRVPSKVLFAIFNILIEKGDFNKAEQVADKERKVSRGKYLLILCKVFAKSGDLDEVKRIVDKMSMLLEEDSNSISLYEKRESLEVFCKALIEKGRFQEAEKLANEIKPQALQEWTLLEICKALLKSGLFDEGKRVAARIVECSCKNHALGYICEALAEMGDFDQAELMAAKMERDYFQICVLKCIARAAINNGDFHRAKKIAEKNRMDKTEVFFPVCIEWLKKRNFNQIESMSMEMPRIFVREVLQKIRLHLEAHDLEGIKKIDELIENLNRVFSFQEWGTDLLKNLLSFWEEYAKRSQIERFF